MRNIVIDSIALIIDIFHFVKIRLLAISDFLLETM